MKTLDWTNGTPKNWGRRKSAAGCFLQPHGQLRSIRCIGYDMDTSDTLQGHRGEGRAYMYAKEHLKKVGFPIEDLIFDAELVCVDHHRQEARNIVKVDRLARKRAMHGTRRLSIRERTMCMEGRLST